MIDRVTKPKVKEWNVKSDSERFALPFEPGPVKQGAERAMLGRFLRGFVKLLLRP